METFQIFSALLKENKKGFPCHLHFNKLQSLQKIILQYTENNDVPGVLFSVDFEKTFDSVEHNFIFAVLKSFGFGSQFIQ